QVAADAHAKYCSAAQIGGPRETSDAPRATFPWKFRSVDAGAPVVGGAGTAADAAASGCSTSGPFSDVGCEGSVFVSRSGNSLSITFGDGSALAWKPNAVPTSLAMPALSDGATVWARYTSSLQVVCPYCGGYTVLHLEIRDRAGGAVFFIADQG